MKAQYKVALLFVALSATMTLTAQSFQLSLNKESGVYGKGERAVIMCQMDSLTADSMTVRMWVNNQLQREERILPQHQTFALFDAAIDSTCAVSVEVSGKGAPEGIGFVVAPEGFKAGYEEPADLMDYWNNQKALLQALPMQVKKTTLEVPEQYQGKFVCDDIEINCLGPAPVRAYMAKPVKAQKGSLPIVILCRAAGVSGAWCRCQVGECVGNAALGNGALSLDLNAHGMLNGQHDDYYRMLVYPCIQQPHRRDLCAYTGGTCIAHHDRCIGVAEVRSDGFRRRQQIQVVALGRAEDEDGVFLLKE